MNLHDPLESPRHDVPTHSSNGSPHRDEERLQWSRKILAGDLPEPGKERWQPLRAGLLNIYLFEDERFPFADGRLLLRGSNATGKSRVMAFLMPFLLDGSLSPSRLEPDRDATRQVAWNLLMGEHRDQLGYTWLELGRLDPELGPIYLTLGCGLRAVEDRGIVEHWFFITPQRIDRELKLVTEQRTPLTRRQLTEALAPAGQLFEKTADYQRAVDDRLFRLGDRYGALLDLLIQLRQPQLARKLDLEHLESALLESLPPLAGNLLATAADAFRSLDSDRRQLQSYQDALTHVTSFLNPYRQHVRIGLRRAAEGVRTATSGYESAGRNMRENRQEMELADKEQSQNLDARAAAERDLQAAEARLHALEQSDEARQVGRLDDKRRLAENSGLNAERLRTAFEQAAERALQEEQRSLECQSQLATARKEAERQMLAGVEAELPPELVSEHRRLLEELSAGEASTDAEIASPFVRLRKEAERWQRYGRRLEEKDRQVDAQRASCRDARQALVSREADLAEGAQRHAEHAVATTQMRAALWNNIANWLASAVEFRELLAQREALEPVWQVWAERMAGVDPFIELLDLAERRISAELATEEAAIAHERELLLESRAQLERRLAELQSANDVPPPAPATRDPASRVSRPGAPLWQLVDFAPTVPSAEHAGWEAALEASGILDAWLAPDGRLSDPTTDDTFLVANDEPPLPWERQLGRVLISLGAETAAGVAPQVLKTVLERLGVGVAAGRVWVDASGRWQNGPLSGCWHKADAQYIGRAARDRNRERLLRETRSALEQLTPAELALESRLHNCAARRERMRIERRLIPDTEPLRDSLARLQGLEAQLHDADRRLREAAEREGREQARLAELVAERERDAADLGLTAWLDRGSVLVRGLERYDLLLHHAERAFLGLALARRRLTLAQSESTRAKEAQVSAQQVFQAANEEALRHSVELATLEETLGAAAAELAHRLAGERAALEEARKRGKSLVDESVVISSRLAVLASQFQQYEQDARRHDEARRLAAQALQARAEWGLLEISQLPLESAPFPWTLTQSIETARAIERESHDTPHHDQAWQSSQTRVHNEREQLRSHLASHEISPELESLADGLQLVKVPFRGAVIRIDELARQLDDEVTAREQVLSERERQIFEEFLLGEVGAELHKRLHEARELVESMNHEVARRPMSTGMQMRFRWELADDAAPDLRAARDVLLSLRATWTSDEREALIRFLQRQIQVERARDEAASWPDQLRAALDYRRWHALRIERRASDRDPWRLLTRRTYGTGSGGEKAIALTIPQLAAAAAYYRSADPHAPRFILLDEAFAGISADNRGGCLELLVSFDLDVVMTSENERGCYPCVPALAICRLSRVPDLPVVLNEVFIWNGKQQLEPPRVNDGRLF